MAGDKKQPALNNFSTRRSNEARAGLWHQLIHRHVGPHFLDVKHSKVSLTRLTSRARARWVARWGAYGRYGHGTMVGSVGSGQPGSSPCIGAMLPCCPPHPPHIQENELKHVETWQFGHVSSVIPMTDPAAYGRLMLTYMLTLMLYMVYIYIYKNIL